MYKKIRRKKKYKIVSVSVSLNLQRLLNKLGKLLKNHKLIDFNLSYCQSNNWIFRFL
jgi:hypothetical protein